ncbi:hypothetical protein B0H10DRAFT_318026 [Mycena sp. CBHHK59/15]|nr:hypothetical protein B0H10DRAFT_318026 [Mycena sp. CBHHK59/15]
MRRTHRRRATPSWKSSSDTKFSGPNKTSGPSILWALESAIQPPENHPVGEDGGNSAMADGSDPMQADNVPATFSTVASPRLHTTITPAQRIASTYALKNQLPLAVNTPPPAGVEEAFLQHVPAPQADPSETSPSPASPSRARKAMQWFRKSRRSITVSSDALSPTAGDVTSPTMVAVTSTPAHPPPPPQLDTTPNSGAQRQRTTSSVSIASLFRKSLRVGGSPSVSGDNKKASGAAALRVHHGAVDQDTITTGRPPDVMRHVRQVLLGMGVQIEAEGEFRYRCIRAKHRDGRDVASESANGQNTSSAPAQSAFSGGAVLRGLLMRRQSPPSAAGPPPFDDGSFNNSGVFTAESASQQSETVYGDLSEDVGDEVRFYVELTRLDRLRDTYSLDIRRIKGNLRSYRFLYDTLRTRAALQR